MTKKERVFAAINGETTDFVPMGFWLHFSEENASGDAAVREHLKYFNESKTDLCKVMNEILYPYTNTLKSSTDWKRVGSYGRSSSYITKSADIVKKVTDEIGTHSPVIFTVHGIFASASHTLLGEPRYDSIGKYAQLYHLRTDPNSIMDAYKKIAESLMILADECLSAGADGIYYAALGGESDGLTDEEHEKYLAPLEIEILDSIKSFKVLHMCKPLVNLQRFKDYPCDVVNWGTVESSVSLTEGRKIFKNKTVLGGIDDRSIILTNGTYEQIEEEVHSVIKEAGTDKFILGSDCTLSPDLSYERIAMIHRACKTYSKP